MSCIYIIPTIKILNMFFENILSFLIKLFKKKRNQSKATDFKLYIDPNKFLPLEEILNVFTGVLEQLFV